MGYETCDVGVIYKYTVVNSGSHPARIDSLVDYSFASMLEDKDTIIEAMEQKEFFKNGTINICTSGGLKIKRKALVVASPVGGGYPVQGTDEIVFNAP